MRILLAVAALPFYIWIIVAAAWGYMTYSSWQTDIYEPLVESIVGKEAEHRRIKADNDKAEAFKPEKDERFRVIQDLELQFRSTTDRIPRTANVPEILKELADIADKVGLQFSSFRPQAEIQDDFLRITPIEVELRGSYAQVMSFLDESAHIRRVVAAKTLQLDNPIARAGSSVVAAKTTMYSYRIEDADRASDKSAKAGDGAGG